MNPSTIQPFLRDATTPRTNDENAAGQRAGGWGECFRVAVNTEISFVKLTPLVGD